MKFFKLFVTFFVLAILTFSAKSSEEKRIGYQRKRQGLPLYGNEGDKPGCFSSEVLIDVKGKGKTLMKDIVIGDNVLTGNGKYEPVYAFSHRDVTTVADFVQIFQENVMEPLEITDKHMVFLEGKPNPVPAFTVKFGDQVQTLQGPRNVTKTYTIAREGIFSPHTADGTIVANGIIASQFSSLFDDSDDGWIQIAGYKIMTHQSFFSKALKPYMYLCTGISIDLCIAMKEKFTIDQVSRDIYFYWAEQKESNKSLLLSFWIVVICLIDIILNPYTLIFPAMLFGWVAFSKTGIYGFDE